VSGDWIDAPITIQTKDADLYVEQVGPQEAPVLYYLHGGPGYSAFSFRDLMGDELEGFRVVYADQRGGGRSYAGGPFTVDDLAGDVATTLDALRLPAATLLAHGFGAIPALRAARLHPERVARVVLINPWFSMPLLARTLQRRAAVLAGAPDEALPDEATLAAQGELPPDALDPDALSERAYDLIAPKQLFDDLEFPLPTTRMRLEHVDAVAQFGPQRADAPEDVWHADALADLADLTVAPVALFGRQDGTSVPDQAEAGLGRRPDATTGLVDAGHYPWIDDPDAFVPLLHEALGGAPAIVPSE